MLELNDRDLNEDLAERPEMVCDLIRLLGRRTRALSAEYTQISATLAQAKAEGAAPARLSLFDRARIALGYYFGGGADRTSPSVEARRNARNEAAPKIASYDRGTVVYREGEPGRCMYGITWGRVGIYAGYGTDAEQKLTELSANQFFGEMGLLEGEARSATAVVLEDGTTLETIGPEDLQALFARNPSEVWMILDHTAQRLRRLTEDYNKARLELADLN